MDTDKLATERILKARSELIASRVFYGTLVSCVEPVLSRKYPTMATDSKRHYYNPDFIMSLTPKKVLGVQVHESEHDARHHSTRRGTRDPEQWNRACDYAINLDLIEEGFELPEGVLIDKKYRGMSAEEIYRCLELDRAKQQPKPQQQPQSGDDESDQDDNQPNSSPDDGEAEQDSNADQSGEGDGDGTDDDAGDQSGQGEDGEEADDAEAEAGAGEPSDGEGDDTTTDGDGASGEAQGDDEGTAGHGSAQSSGDPGQCGEVLDAAEDAADIADADQHWEMVTRQAVALSKRAGDLPGYMTREIEKMNASKQNWREVLRAWIDQGAQRIQTWNRPNRRFIGRGLILPGSQPDGVNKVVFIVDTSGSVDGVALATVATEAQAALDDGAINEAIAVYNDTRVTKVDTFYTQDEIKFDPRGGGGTDLRPAFKWVEDNAADASLIVVFTDGYIGDPGPMPLVPVLFAFHGYPQIVRKMIETAPWQAPGIDVGEH